MRGGVEFAECCIELLDPTPHAVLRVQYENNHVITNLFVLWVGKLASSPRVPRVAGFCINNARAFSNRFQVDFEAREKT